MVLNPTNKAREKEPTLSWNQLHQVRRLTLLFEQCVIMPVMSENWVMLCIGVLLVVFGFTVTAVSGAMPGAKPLYPPRL